MERSKELANELLALPIDWTPLQKTLQNQNIQEYHRFLVMKALLGDIEVDDLQLSPSGPVDQVWHAHLLLPKHYALVCKTLIGCNDLFDHSINTAKDPNREHRYSHTLEFYKSIWGEPDAQWWPNEVTSIQVYVSGFGTQPTLVLSVQPNQPLSRLFDAAIKRWGIECCKGWGFYYAGNALKPQKTLADYGIVAESTIRARGSLAGC